MTQTLGVKLVNCRHIPIELLPKNRLDFVDDVGGGGFWIWEAVGARDWRMEYVRCIDTGLQCR